MAAASGLGRTIGVTHFSPDSDFCLHLFAGPALSLGPGSCKGGWLGLTLPRCERCTGESDEGGHRERPHSLQPSVILAKVPALFPLARGQG